MNSGEFGRFLIVEVIPQVPSQVISTEDDQMIETLFAELSRQQLGAAQKNIQGDESLLTTRRPQAYHQRHERCPNHNPSLYSSADRRVSPHYGEADGRRG